MTVAVEEPSSPLTDLAEGNKGEDAELVPNGGDVGDGEGGDDAPISDEDKIEHLEKMTDWITFGKVRCFIFRCSIS